MLINIYGAIIFISVDEPVAMLVFNYDADNVRGNVKFNNVMHD